MNFSAQEPAAREVPVILSRAEVAAVILFHQRQRNRIAKLAGEIALGQCKDAEHLPPTAKANALEACQEQSSAHEARAFELAAILKRSASETKYQPTHHSSN